jgi:hypothetical protein
MDDLKYHWNYTIHRGSKFIPKVRIQNEGSKEDYILFRLAA